MSYIEFFAVGVGGLLVIWWLCHLYMDCFSQWLEARLEELEFQADRTYGGLMESFPGLRGHSPFAQLSFAVLLAFLILGPNLFWKPGDDVPSLQIQFASWCFGLCVPVWIAKHLLKHGSSGIGWIGFMVGLGAIPAFFSASVFWTIRLSISGAVICLLIFVWRSVTPHFPIPANAIRGAWNVRRPQLQTLIHVAM